MKKPEMVKSEISLGSMLMDDFLPFFLCTLLIAKIPYSMQAFLKLWSSLSFEWPFSIKLVGEDYSKSIINLYIPRLQLFLWCFAGKLMVWGEQLILKNQWDHTSY